MGKIYFEGEYYNSYHHLYTSKGVNCSTFQKRIKNGWSLHECIYGKEKFITFEGIKYKNYRDLCLEKNVNYKKFLNNKRYGKSLEECLKNSIESIHKSKQIAFEGKHYKSYSHLCREKNVNFQTFHTRLKKGYSIEECVYGKEKIKTEIEYEGKVYQSYSELCKEKGVKLPTFLNRLRSGKSIEESLKNKIIEFEGIEYKSLKELCEKYKVNYHTFLSRKKQNLTLRECIFGRNNVNIDVFKDVIMFEGNSYSSYDELCEKYEIDFKVFMRRINMGWYIDDCIYGRTLNDDSAGIEYDGVIYLSFKILCEKYNQDYKKVHYRVNTLGWSLGKALNYKDANDLLNPYYKQRSKNGSH